VERISLDQLNEEDMRMENWKLYIYSILGLGRLVLAKRDEVIVVKIAEADSLNTIIVKADSLNTVIAEADS